MSAVTGWLRGHRALTGITATVLVSIAVLSAVTAGSAVHDGDLDPQNPSGNGAQAVARVLGDHGVHVSVVRRAAALERAAVDRDTTVVVTSPENLGRTTAHQVQVRTLRAGALVLAREHPGQRPPAAGGRRGPPRRHTDPGRLPGPPALGPRARGPGDHRLPG